MKYIFCDSDVGGTPTNTTPDTSTSKYHTTSTWPANGARWASIASAMADTTIVGIADDLTFLVQGSADFAAFNTGTLTSALSVLVEGNATGAVWDDTKVTCTGSAGGGVANLSLAVSQTVKNIQLVSTISSGTPRGAYCSGTGACTLENLKIRFTGTTSTGGPGITGTTAPPASVTAKNCIVDVINSNSSGSNSGISLQTATVGNFYNCVFRGAGTGATNGDNLVNCVFIGFSTQGGSSGNYKYCVTVNGTGTNPVTVSSWADTFIDYQNFDYRLRTGSALIGTGIGPSADASVPTTDIAGNTRSGSTTDVGATMYAPVLTITSIDSDNTVYDNQVANITGTGFGTVQGLVYIDGVQQSINSWTDTVINITVEQGALSLGAATLKVFKPI
jgi:hypothetical protein